MADIYFGIDPGSHGAIAKVEDYHSYVFAESFWDFEISPDMGEVEIAYHLSEVFDGAIASLSSCDRLQGIVLERAPSHVQNRAGIARYLVIVGGLYTLATKACNRVYDCRPQDWKDHWNLTGYKATDPQYKKRSRDCCAEVFPESCNYLKLQKDHDRAEAALIAEYWRRENVEQVGLAA